MQALAQWVLGPVWQGILLVALCYMVPYFDIVAIVIQVLITLRQGLPKGLCVALGGILLGIVTSFLISKVLLPNELDFGFVLQSLRWSLVLSIPLLGFAELLRRTVSLSLTLQAMTLAFMALFAFCYSSQLNIAPPMIISQISNSVNAFTNLMIEAENTSSDLARSNNRIFTAEVIDTVKQFLVYLFITITVYSIYLSLLLLARLWQSYVFMPKEFSKEFRAVRCGQLLAMILVVSWFLVVGVVTNAVALFALAGTLVIGVFWLILAGVAFSHWVMNFYRISWMGMVFFYILLILPVLSSILLLLLILVGLVDGFVDLRRLIVRMRGPATDIQPRL